jgi:hypothetical protein
MPSGQGAFGGSSIVAEFQGFVSGAAGAPLVTRAAQNCQVVKLATGQYQLQLNNVVPDDCNFMAQVHQFVYLAGQAGIPVSTAFPPVGSESTGLPALNYMNFGFYNSSGTPVDPNAYGLFNIVVFNCNDGLVGFTRTPGNP